MIKIFFKDRDKIDSIEKITKKLDRDIVRALDSLGVTTRDQMRNIIKTNKKRASGNKNTLEESIEVKKIGNRIDLVGFGVGEIDLLKRKAPYYLALNYGSNHIVGKRVPRGEFRPGDPKPDGNSDPSGRWRVGQGNYSFIARQGIKAIDYIDRTVNWLDHQFDKILNIVRRR